MERPANKRNRTDTLGDPKTTKRRLADEGSWSSDSDYDDLDDMVTPSDLENFTSDDDDSVVTTDSNTPSVVGENLESFSLAESEKNNNKTTAGGKGKRDLGPCSTDSIPPLCPSLFPLVPPSIHFFPHNRTSETPFPPEIRKFLRWKLSNITPAVVKRVISNSGFRLMRKNGNTPEWEGTWGNHIKSSMFKTLPPDCSKINHFPGTFNIGRKDKLWKNYHRLKLKFGKEEFSFLPRTFCLPQEGKLLRKVWAKRGGKEKWIVKPPALSRGSGIRVVSKWCDVPKCRPLIVQKYISKPHLINNTKYDLRIYVLVTSMCPLKIYLFDDGLARFASNKYDPDPTSLSDVYMHLTNYSINKNSSNYLHNEDADARQGHKWTLASLWEYFKENGIDHEAVWSRIKDLVIKTIVSAEEQMYKLYKSNLSNHYSTYELFGFDVLLDSTFKPWLIEVNISPSLHSASPLDLDIKSALASEVFNIVRFHVPAKLPLKTQKNILAKLGLNEVSSICYDRRLYIRELSKSDKSKQDLILASCVSENIIQRDRYLDQILEKLTPDDIRWLIRTEDELAQTKRFERIFPTKDTHRYFKFFNQPRYYNLLMDAWETKYSGSNRESGLQRLSQCCRDKIHWKVPATSSCARKKKSHIVNVSMLKAPTTGKDAASLSGSSSTSVLNQRRNSISPEPMSTGGDSAIQSENEKSRSPSPLTEKTTSALNDNQDIQNNTIKANS